MSQNKPKKPVVPIYFVGLVWLLYSRLFGFSGILSLLICTGLSLFVFKQMNKSAVKKQLKEKAVSAEPVNQEPVVPEKKDKPFTQEPLPSTGNPVLDDVVTQGRDAVKHIQILNDDIPDFKISAQLKQIEILTSAIIDQVEKKEDKQKQVRQFMNYYLPTTIKLLEQYVQLQNVGLKGDNIEKGMTQIEDMLDKVIIAFQKQLDSLFESDLIDITADIQVMEQMMASQGLTDQKDFKLN